MYEIVNDCLYSYGWVLWLENAARKGLTELLGESETTVCVHYAVQKTNDFITGYIQIYRYTDTQICDQRAVCN